METDRTSFFFYLVVVTQADHVDLAASFMARPDVSLPVVMICVPSIAPLLYKALLQK